MSAKIYMDDSDVDDDSWQQWDIAMEFDSRYTDVEWVRQQKHWPPKMIQALIRFLELT